MSLQKVKMIGNKNIDYGNNVKAVGFVYDTASGELEDGQYASDDTGWYSVKLMGYKRWAVHESMFDNRLKMVTPEGMVRLNKWKESRE